MTCVIIHRLSHFKVRVLFIDSVVRQMHVQIVHGLFVSVGLNWLVLVRGEPDETFLVEEYLQWFTAKHEHVESQVKLESIDEVGVLHVLLHDG